MADMSIMLLASPNCSAVLGFELEGPKESGSAMYERSQFCSWRASVVARVVDYFALFNSHDPIPGLNNVPSPAMLAMLDMVGTVSPCRCGLEDRMCGSSPKYLSLLCLSLFYPSCSSRSFPLPLLLSLLLGILSIYLSWL